MHGAHGREEIWSALMRCRPEALSRYSLLPCRAWDQVPATDALSAPRGVCRRPEAVELPQLQANWSTQRTMEREAPPCIPPAWSVGHHGVVARHQSLITSSPHPPACVRVCTPAMDEGRPI